MFSASSAVSFDGPAFPPSVASRASIVGLIVAVAWGLAACSSAPPAAPDQPVPAPVASPPAPQADSRPTPPDTHGGTEPWSPLSPEDITTPATSPAWAWADAQALPAPAGRTASVWTPVPWSDLPGWGTDNLAQAWNAWLRNCERPPAVLAALCPDVRRLSLATVREQHDWVMTRFQAYRLSDAGGQTTGLLTGYFEPEMTASRQPAPGFTAPIHRTPQGWSAQQPWFSRQEMDTRPDAQAALAGRALAYLPHPVDVMMLQVQGSGRLRIHEPDGRISTSRMAFAGHNGHAYQSIATPLLRSQRITSASWESIKAWAMAHPDDTAAMLWHNPRVVFFDEVPLTGANASNGPRGAQGVPLTPGRAIAVDRRSLPYGTPVWLATDGPTTKKQKLVFAQDTGAAIVGAVRADYFGGWGDAAYQEVARLKQPLHLWALWPRGAAVSP